MRLPCLKELPNILTAQNVHWLVKIPHVYQGVMLLTDHDVAHSQTSAREEPKCDEAL